ncbi:MAG: MMPL family transporter [Candidatus Poseidonia sp.]|jgi:predicted RND superfamily exporter protein|nr:MMPL family transporter [Poseidonia sp.]
MSRRYDRLADWLLPRKRGAHIAVMLLTLLMIPGAMTALQPIDMESYEMESPELSAQTLVNEEFPNSEIILGFLVSTRDPVYVPEVNDWTPVPRMADGSPDYASLIPPSEMLEAGEPWSGIDAPTGGILNLTVLQELDTKLNLVLEHPLGPALKPLVNDVTGHRSNGAISLSDHFRGFMNNTSILTQPGLTPLGVVTDPPTNWTDCFPLACLTFDDPNVTQAHIDMAAARMAEASDNNFLRWLSLDRGFKADYTAYQDGPIFGQLQADGSWEGALWGKGRWTASSTWLLVQLDRTQLETMGWEVVWKDAHQEKQVQFTDEGFRVGGYRLADGQLVLHPPQYTEAQCLELQAQGEGCATEWSYMDLEGHLRSHDRTTVTLLLGQGVNVEVNRELQSSAGLIALMGLAIVVLLFFSLRRWSDVVIVMFALGAALLWMQGLIGHFANLTGWLGLSLIARSQFSNLLPILVLALGIDDSLHALHRYKEERANGKSSHEAGHITLARVGRAITLTSITTMAAFAANLFSDIAALRSFGIEAALGILAAFLLTGLWAPLLRVSADDWLDARAAKRNHKEVKSLVNPAWLRSVTHGSGQRRTSTVITLIAVLLTVPAAVGMAQLEGDFAVEDFLDERSDFAVGVDELSKRFADEGEPANLLILGDVLDPRVFAAIDTFRQDMDALPEGVPDKITRQPDGTIDILALDEMVFAAQGSLVLDSAPFEAAGWQPEVDGFGMNCSLAGNGPLVDTTDRDCLAFFYGFLSLNGVPGVGPIPDIPASIVQLYIMPEVDLDPTRPWLDVNGEPAAYGMMQIRFGMTQPEDFPGMQGGVAEVWRDLEVFTNLSSGTYEEPGEEEADKPLTWVMLTGRPITRYTASTAMQDEMQSSLILGSLFVLASLSIGFRSPKQAVVTFVPILLVVIWLYGLMYVAGSSLNIVTVTIATISLGVGIDYCIHVTERYREGRENGESHSDALAAVGGACGLALLGSATSDIAGFLVIALSPMGLFSNFGIFSAAMIALSLVASLVLTTAALGLISSHEDLPHPPTSSPADEEA